MENLWYLGFLGFTGFLGFLGFMGKEDKMYYCYFMYFLGFINFIFFFTFKSFSLINIISSSIFEIAPIFLLSPKRFRSFFPTSSNIFPFLSTLKCQFPLLPRPGSPIHFEILK